MQTQIKTEETSSEDEDCYFLVCLELPRNCCPKEESVQYMECQCWSHVAYSKGATIVNPSWVQIYICPLVNVYDIVHFTVNINHSDINIECCSLYYFQTHTAFVIPDKRDKSNICITFFKKYFCKYFIFN